MLTDRTEGGFSRSAKPIDRTRSAVEALSTAPSLFLPLHCCCTQGARDNISPADGTEVDPALQCSVGEHGSAQLTHSAGAYAALELVVMGHCRSTQVVPPQEKDWLNVVPATNTGAATSAESRLFVTVTSVHKPRAASTPSVSAVKLSD